MAYFAGIESQKDRDLNRAIPGLRDVLLSPDDPMPIGVAFRLGPNCRAAALEAEHRRHLGGGPLRHRQPRVQAREIGPNPTLVLRGAK